MTSENPERMAGPEGEPAHVEQAVINIDHADMSPGARRAARRLAWSLVVLFVVAIAIGAGNLLFTNSQVHDLRATQVQAAENSAVLHQQLLADCGFYRDLSGLPLQNAPNGHPSKLGVQIISDSRGAWHGHGCPGMLPSPDPSFVAGAKFYKIPVN